MKRLCLVLLLMVAGCAAGPRSTPSGSGADDAAFERLSDEYLTGYHAFRPLDAMQLGLHGYDGLLTDYSKTSLDTELARLRDFDRRLGALDTSALSTVAYYDFRILRASIKRELFSFEVAGTFDRNPMTYAGALDVSPYIKRNFAPLEQRVRSIIAILNQAPKVTAAARANLGESLPKPWVETAIQVGDGTVDFLQKDLVDALKDVKDQALLAEFQGADKRAVSEMQGLVKYLKEEKLPKANDAFALGRNNFAKMLRDGELVDMTPESVLDFGMEELRREQQQFAEVAAKIDPTHTPIEVFKAIQHTHPTAESLIPDVRKDLEAIRAFVVAHHIVVIPSEVLPTVTETLPFDRAGSFASMDSPGAFETKATEAYYYVTPVEATWTAQQKEEWLTSFNYYTTDVVTIHEVFPGHYVQFLTLHNSPATRIEKTMNSYAYVEGWAHYGEQMLIDEGYGAAAPDRGEPSVEIKAAKYRLAQLDESLLRVCRLCVSIKMHCEGMSVGDAAKFFHDNCYYEDEPARQEALRGTFDPGYMNYTLGKQMILKLRRDYQAQEGAAYSLEKFHNEMLRRGMPPVPLLREFLLKDRSQWDKVL